MSALCELEIPHGSMPGMRTPLSENRRVKSCFTYSLHALTYIALS
ncbi:hypothetical protein [Tropheryma whipplei]|nr:hypothetical protein [Tropheryma whipplei]